MNIQFNVSNHSLSIASPPTLFSGNENYYICTFDFLTPEWDSLLKFAVFTFENTAVSVPIEDGLCHIPSEVLSASGTICVGVFGSNPSDEGYVRISTGIVYLYVGEGGYKDAAAPSSPSPDLWEQYYAEITKVGGFAQRAETAALASENSARSAQEDSSSATQALSDLLKIIDTDIATLVNGKIPVSQIPSIATTEIYSASSLEEMNEISAENGDICIRGDENKSYIFSNGWVYLVAPTDYASRSAYAETSGTAQNATMINNHRLVEISAQDFETAVKDPDTYYLVY